MSGGYSPPPPPPNGLYEQTRPKVVPSLGFMYMIEDLNGVVAFTAIG